MAAFLARNYSVKFMCIRQFQNRITDSVYTVVKEKIEKAGWTNEFDIGVSTIKHKVTGSEFLFYGMARNIEEIKGIEGVDICWIEEGEGLTEAQWSIIDPTIRKEGAEIWILWNPDLITDFVQVKLPSLLGDDCVIRHINYDENPFLSDTAKEKAERLKKNDPEEYGHIYLGIPRSSGDNALIKHEWVEASIDAHKWLGIVPTGERMGSLDVADEGTDKNAFCGSHGILIEYLEQWSGKGSDIYATAEKAFDICDVEGYLGFEYDSDGLGASIRGDARKISEERSSKKWRMLAVNPWRGSGSVYKPDGEMVIGRKNKDFFMNLKAQGWWTLRECFRETYRAVKEGRDFDPERIISLSSSLNNLDQLKMELSQVTYTKKDGGKIVVDKAPEGTKSPNLADAVMIRRAPKPQSKVDYSKLV